MYCRMASNWDTVEVFVTSYGRDFTKEREVVAKQVILDLEAWCETKKIQINVTEFKWVSILSDIDSSTWSHHLRGDWSSACDSLLLYFESIASKLLEHKILR